MIDVVAWINEEWNRQKAGGNGHSGGNGSGGSRSAVNRLHAPSLGKIGPGERHASLLTFANSRWRFMCNAVGIARLEDSDIEDEILLDVLGRNILCCDPPKTQDEVRVIVQSSRGFMMNEILREADEKRAMEWREPLSGGNSRKDDVLSYIGWLKSIGVRLVRDSRFPDGSTTLEREDKLVADEWKCERLTGADEDRVRVTVCVGMESPAVVVEITESDFEKPRIFAAKVDRVSGGTVKLDREFAQLDWKSVWLGRKFKGDGVLVGLYNYLVNQAVIVAENGEVSLIDQIYETVRGLAQRSRSEIVDDLEFWAKNRLFEEKDFCGCRLGPGIAKESHARSDAHTREHLRTSHLLPQPDDPLTGWYKPEVGKTVMLFAKFDEVVKRYRGAYGSGVSTKKLSDAMKEMGFERMRIKSGVLEGRWLVKKVFDD